MTKSEALARIEKELGVASYALKTGNDGMVRVCARRAAGIAITYWLEQNPRQGWGVDAMSLLKNIQLIELMPMEVRDAALRLTTKVTDQFTSPFSTDPILDCKTIINHLLQ